MKSFLQRLFRGPATRTIEHPVFGKATFVDVKARSYWECEPQFGEDTLGVAVESPNGEDPSPRQEIFYREITSDLDATFKRAAPVLIPEYEKWIRQPFPSDWRKAFKFVGLSVPINGDEKENWDLQFDCIPDKQGHMFTCYFESGIPAGVTVDG